MTDGQGPFISPNELVQKEMAPKTHVYLQLMPQTPRVLPERWEGAESRQGNVQADGNRDLKGDAGAHLWVQRNLDHGSISYPLALLKLSFSPLFALRG